MGAARTDMRSMSPSKSSGREMVGVSLDEQEAQDFEDFLEWRRQRGKGGSVSQQRSASPSKMSMALVPVTDKHASIVADTHLKIDRTLKGDEVVNPTRYLREVKVKCSNNEFAAAHVLLNHAENHILERENLAGWRTKPRKASELFKGTIIAKAAIAAQYKYN